MLNRNREGRHLGGAHPRHQGRVRGRRRRLPRQGHQPRRHHRGHRQVVHRHRGAQLPQDLGEHHHQVGAHRKFRGDAQQQQQQQ